MKSAGFKAKIELSRLTWTVDEGPVILGIVWTHADIEGRLRVGGQPRQCGGSRDRGLERPTVGALDALTFTCVTGVGAPTTAWLVQTLTTGPVARTVLCCRTTHMHTYYLSYTCNYKESSR